jgi:hypothetical protein
MGMSEQYSLPFIIFYVSLFSIIALFGYAGFTDLSSSGQANILTYAPPSMSQYESSLTFLNYLEFVFNIVIYFFFLQGLGVFGLPAVYSIVISLPLTIGFLWCIVGLIRG